jgi:hypothetical protein
MKNILLVTLLFVTSISFAQDEIKYKTAFESVERNCDSIKHIKFCYLKRFQLVVLRKFSDEIKTNKKLSKNIDDPIYMEIEIDTTGKFIINKLATKSKDFEESLIELIKILPSIKPFENEKKEVINFKAILDFELKEIDFNNSINTDDKKDSSLLKIPKFSNCKSIQDEISSKKCFTLEMNNHIMNNFSYPKKAINNNITGRAIGNFVISKEGRATNFIVFDTDFLLLKETLRILKLLPKFIPGTYDKKNVGVSYSQPLKFQLKKIIKC